MKGKFTGGRVNYGYSCHEQKLSVIDEEAAVLLEIFTDYANGKSLTDIANDLNARGITNRGKPFLMNSRFSLCCTSDFARASLRTRISRAIS